MVLTFNYGFALKEFEFRNDVPSISLAVGLSVSKIFKYQQRFSESGVSGRGLMFNFVRFYDIFSYI